MPPRRRLASGFAFIAVLGLGLAGASPLAAAPTHPMAPCAVPALLAEWQWWTDMKAWFSQQASNRSRVVQFGLAGMVVALLVLYSASNRKR